MDAKTGEVGIVAPTREREATTFEVIGALSLCHLMNDLMQSLVPAIYPILKTAYQLDFGQIGLITLTFQLTASLLQPAVGLYTDRNPKPFSLVIGMGSTLIGLLCLAVASSYGAILAGAALIGTGSSVFHPEASRIARVAAGGRYGLAQSLFQVGGNFGQACGPLMAAFIVAPRGQGSLAWFSLIALVGMVLLAQIGRWYRDRLIGGRARAASKAPTHVLTRRQVGVAVALLMVLTFSKNVYTSSLTSYYTFYLIERFQLPVRTAQILLFVFLGSVALGTVLGGPLVDRFGRKFVILFSVLGALPFTLALPHVGLAWTVALTVPIGMILASSFPAILVFAQDLLPGRVGVVSGLFFGLAFGMGGLGAAVFGELADHTSIAYVYQLSAWLPALGLVALLLPDLKRYARAA